MKKAPYPILPQSVIDDMNEMEEEAKRNPSSQYSLKPEYCVHPKHSCSYSNWRNANICTRCNLPLPPTETEAYREIVLDAWERNKHMYQKIGEKHEKTGIR